MNRPPLSPVTLSVHDHLLDRCSKWRCYPVNLLRRGQLKYVLNTLLNYLNQNEERLFDARAEELRFLEAYDGDKEYQSRSVKNSKDLRKHLHDNRKDPRCRHIFVQANDSRAPLNCSRESLTYTLAFHQVAPSFLNYVSSFGDTKLPLDYSMTGFQAEDNLGESPEEVLEFEKLGRSGYEIRTSYILRSVERDEKEYEEDGKERSPWKIRQTAVYHSYDMVTGRAFWMTVKANSLMIERITEASSELPALRAPSLERTESGFSATLATHIIYFDWCDENWRHCINDIEEELRKILTKAKTLRFDQDSQLSTIPEVIKQAVSRKGTMMQPPQVEPKKLARSQTAFASIYSTTTSIFSLLHKAAEKTSKPNKWRLFARESTASAQRKKEEIVSSVKHLQSKITSGASKDGQDGRPTQLEKLRVLDMFSFSELQKLHDIGERIEEMRLVIKLDGEVLHDVKEYYASLMEREEVPRNIRKECQKDLAGFLRRVERIERNLEIRRAQVESMLSWLKDGKTLFDGILQYRSVQVSRIFAEVAHKQADRMEKIAYKTEQETTSMHVITFVALIFLPGTFVATFFQSGLLTWQSNGDARVLQFNVDGFDLFAKICFPLMAATLLAWWFFYAWLKRRARRRFEEGEV